jgi:hypothetical protein
MRRGKERCGIKAAGQNAFGAELIFVGSKSFNQGR